MMFAVQNVVVDRLIEHACDKPTSVEPSYSILKTKKETMKERTKQVSRSVNHIFFFERSSTFDSAEGEDLRHP